MSLISCILAARASLGFLRCSIFRLCIQEWEVIGLFRVDCMITSHGVLLEDDRMTTP